MLISNYFENQFVIIFPTIYYSIFLCLNLKCLNPSLMYFIFSTLESVGSMSGTLRVNASDEAFRITAQKFTDVKLENEKKS